MDELVLVTHAEVCEAWANWVRYKRVTGQLDLADENFLSDFQRLTGWCSIATSRTNRSDLGIYLPSEQANRVRWMGGTHGVTLLKAYAAKYAKEAI